jgi:hypothetical protein
MGCCSWLCSVVFWVTGLYSSKRYEDDSDSSEEIPVPRFRDLGEPKHRFTRTYYLREKKPVCYTEDDTEDLE